MWTMRLLKRSAFFLTLMATLAILAFPLRAQETPASPDERGGTAPRSSADKYKAHASLAGVSIGAELLTRKEVSKEFAADVNRCCLVVEVAVYPHGTEPLKLSRDDFTLAVEGMDVGVKPQRATVVSARLTRGASSGVTTVANAGVGVEFGTYTDPVTGQPVHGRAVTTSVGAGVGTGSSAPPAVAQHNREAIERELGEKSMPQAKISVPVCGYLYFSVAKQKKQVKYRLEYSIRGETLVLRFP